MSYVGIADDFLENLGGQITKMYGLEIAYSSIS